ncbi:MAG: hypothetical protein HRU14_00130 [Planctomycetes bacterium]|nr:hypothetical protein [Planctomycetota bacterium]
MSVLFHVANVTIFLFILVGAFMHHRRDLHVKMMLTAFALDLVLLLAVELSNSAVARAYRDVGAGNAITTIHVAFAISGLVMWFVQIFVGRKIYKQGRMELLPRHGTGARLFLIFRLGNVVTAFML